MDDNKNKELEGNTEEVSEETPLEGATGQVLVNDAISDDTRGEEIAEQAATGEPAGMEEAEEIMEEKREEEPKKKGKTGWIIGIVIALVVLITAGITSYFYFFNKTLVGSWSGDTNGVATVLTFKQDGAMTLNMGSINIDGTYEKKDKATLNINITVDGSDVLVGDYNYEITSGFSNRKLRLTASNKTVEYESSEIKQIEAPENFTPTEKLTGKWLNEKLGYTYEFTDKGFAIFKKDNMTVTLTYSAAEEEITLKGQMGGVEQENNVKYSIADDKLTLAGIEYVKQS